MSVHAIVHTTGVVLGKTYVPLELAYVDVTGYEITLQLKSPMSFKDAKRHFPHARPDAIMSSYKGLTVDDVMHFLRSRYVQLQLECCQADIVFGCKGRSQMNVLIGLPHVENLETVGVPSLKVLRHPHTVDCPLHVAPTPKCARYTVRLLASYVFQQNGILPLG